MKKSFLLACVFLAAPAHADRIGDLQPADRCAYAAWVQVAAYGYFEEGKPLAEVPMQWRGDETQEEMDFVTRAFSEAYAWLEQWKGSSNEALPVASFSDMVYQSCMKKQEP